MTAAFGTTCAATFPEDRLVEYAHRLDVWSLPFEKSSPGGGPASTGGGWIIIGKFRIQTVWDEPMPGCRRVWGACQACSSRARYLCAPKFLCRICTRLEYCSQHSRSGRPVKIIWLRRRLGISPYPFDPLPYRPPHHTRFHRLAREIEFEEPRQPRQDQSRSEEARAGIKLEAKATQTEWNRLVCWSACA
jgi:hypothetical protein